MPDQFLNMEFGDFMRISIGHNFKELEKKHEYRNVLAALCHTDPRKIFTLPGDYDNVPVLLSKEENLEILRKHGLDKILQIKGEC